MEQLTFRSVLLVGLFISAILGVELWINGENQSLISPLNLRGTAMSSKFECTEDAADMPVESADGKRVLVTGAAGFIGSHVARYCRHLGFEVVAVDDMSGGFEDNIPAGVTFVQGDCKDGAFVEKLFSEHGHFDYVYHLAAYAAEGLSHFIRNFNYDNNLLASVKILNQCVLTEVETVVFTSSIAAFGAVPPPITETSIPQPEDPYGIGKYAMELDLRAAHEMFGINFIIFRPHNVYGPNQNIADKYRNVIGIFMRQILDGEPMTIFGDGKQTRSFSYIQDVAPVIAISPLVPQARNEDFFVGADQPYSLNTLAIEVASAMGVEPEIKHLDARLEVQNAEASHAKMHCIFDPPKATTLEEGLEKMAAWVKSRGIPFKPVNFGNIEVPKNMPPSWVVDDKGDEGQNN